MTNEKSAVVAPRETIDLGPRPFAAQPEEFNATLTNPSIEESPIPDAQWEVVAEIKPTNEMLMTTALHHWQDLVFATQRAHHDVRVRPTIFDGYVLEVLLPIRKES